MVFSRIRIKIAVAQFKLARKKWNRDRQWNRWRRLTYCSNGSIQVQVDGGTIQNYGTFSSFDVASPGSPGAANSAHGMTNIQGLLGANFFVLIFENSSADL